MTDKVQKIKEFLIGMAGAACCDAKTKKVIETHILPFIDSMQKEPASEDLETELDKYIKDHFTIDKEQLDRFGLEEKDYMYSMDKSDMLAMVRHFANWQKEQMMAKAVDVEVKVDAGGYPYIPQMELYDYDKDIPLAKEGDKYKVILIKEN